MLGISEEVIKDFDVEKTIFNINHHNYKDANISEGATTYAIVQQINPLEKIVELYERLLKSEQDKIEILEKIYEIITARFSNLIYRRMETIENIKIKSPSPWEKDRTCTQTSRYDSNGARPIIRNNQAGCFKNGTNREN